MSGESFGNTCARGEWCASATRERDEDTGKTVRTPVECPRTFCDADWSIITGALKALPGDYERLAAVIGDKPQGERLVRIPFGPAIPLRADVDEVMRLVVDAVMVWAEHVAADRGWSAPGSQWAEGTRAWRAQSLGGRAGGLLDKPVKMLVESQYTLLQLTPRWTERPITSALARVVYASDGEVTSAGTFGAMAGGRQAGNEFLRIEWLARAVMGETPPPVTEFKGVACRQEKCKERKTLVLADPPQHDGDPEYHSRCRGCGDLMTLVEYREHVARYEAFYRDRLSPAQRAAVLAGRPLDAGGDPRPLRVGAAGFGGKALYAR